MSARNSVTDVKPHKIPMELAWNGTPRRGVYFWEDSTATPEGILCTMKTPCPTCQHTIFLVKLTVRICQRCGAESLDGAPLAQEA